MALPLIGAQRAYYDDAYTIRQYEHYVARAERYMELTDATSQKKYTEANNRREECWYQLSPQGQITVSIKRHEGLTDTLNKYIRRGDIANANLYRERLARSRERISILRHPSALPRGPVPIPASEQKDIII